MPMDEAEKYSDATSEGEEPYFPDATPGMKQQLTPDSGVVKECLVEGSGTARPPKGAKVQVHYVGTLQDGGSKFDSSRDRGEPFEFTLGDGAVIKGWDLGVATMRKGEKSILTCTADYAYGARGSPPTIPANATLCFEVELLSWIETTDISKEGDGSLMKKVYKEGEKWDKPEYESQIKAAYWKDGDEDNKTELDTVLGEGGVPDYIETTLESMKKGEKCHVEVGSPENVWFVELHEFTNPPSRYQMKAEEKLAAAEERRLRGNDFYKKKELALAERKYKRAIEFLEDDYGMEEEQKKEAKQKKLPCLTNLAAVQLANKSYNECIASCDKALEVDPQNEKALVRKAKALNAKDAWMECKAVLNRLLEIHPTSADGQQEMKKLRAKEKAQDAKDKKKYGNLFAKLAKMEEKEAKVDGKAAAEEEAPKKEEEEMEDAEANKEE